MNKWGLKFIKLLGYLVVAAAIAFGVDLYRNNNVPTTLPNELTLTSLAGEPLSIAKMCEEEPVLLYFWATWCPVCPTVSPTVDWLSDDYNVISVALRSGHNTKISAYLEQQELGFITVNDTQGAIARQFNITATPTILIINNHKVTSATSGFTSPPGILARLWLSKF